MVCTIAESLLIIQFFFEIQQIATPIVQVNSPMIKMKMNWKYVLVLEKTESVKNNERQVRNPISNEGIVVTVQLGYVAIDPKVSMRNFIRIESTYYKNLMKMILTVVFCKLLSNRTIKDQNILFNTCFVSRMFIFLR